jgi:hypothetical protein
MSQVKPKPVDSRQFYKNCFHDECNFRYEASSPTKNKNEHNMKSAATALDPINIWTSGGSQGEHCDAEKVYSWCTNRAQVNKQELPWSDANPPQLNKSCIYLNSKDAKFALDYADCKTENQVICEV